MIYQITFLVEDEKDKTTVNQTIGSLAGKVLEERVIGKRKLTYPIKKISEANYFTYHFEIDPEVIGKLDKKLHLQEQILRFIILKTETIIKPITPIIEQEPVKVKKKIEKPVKPVEKVEKPVEIKKPAEAVSESERLKALEEKLKEILKEWLV